MSGERPADPYLAERRDEEAFFEVWFQLQRHESWKKLYPDERFHENWGSAAHGDMLKAWMARAFFHVTPGRFPSSGEAKP